jgi:hypothetical protein
VGREWAIHCLAPLAISSSTACQTDGTKPKSLLADMETETSFLWKPK